MSLTEVSNMVRKALPFAILGFLGMLILFYSIKLLLIISAPPQTQQLYLNPVFGRIDPPTFAVSTSSAGFNFSLDTIEGIPVTATKSANVYFLPDNPVRFGYQQKVNLVAKNFNFDTTSLQYTLTGRVATINDAGRTLTVDIGNFNFDYQNDVSGITLVTGSIVKSQKEILNDAISFLKSVGRFPTELGTGTNNIIYLSYDPASGNFTNVDTPDLAQAVEVDFFRPQVNGFDIVTPKFFNSDNYVIMTYPDKTYDVIKAKVDFFEKDDTQMGIYPVITGDQAWANLKAGQGIVVAGQSGLTNVSIKKMGLYYLDPDVYQPYLEPVYVFIGDNDFVAYLPAIDPGYLTAGK